MSSYPESGPHKHLNLRLYIRSNTAFSDAALANFHAIAKQHLAGRYALEVVDVRDEPMRALSDGAFAVPTLILISESGNRAVIGDLSDTNAVLKALSVTCEEGQPSGPAPETDP